MAHLATKHPKTDTEETTQTW